MTKKDIINFLINEASLARVYDHTQHRNIGMISAMRGERTAPENEEAHRELGHKIRKAGYGYIHTHSAYTENQGTPQERNVKEKSYMVIGRNKDDGGNLRGMLKKWGGEYNQDAILHKSHDTESAQLHHLKANKIEDIGKWHPNRAGEFASYLSKKKGRNFEFSHDENKAVNESVSVKFIVEPGFFTRYTSGANWRNTEHEF